MKFKKTFIALTLCAVVAVSPLTASAHHGSKGHSTKHSYSVCTVKNCHKTGNHKHNSTTYASRCSTYGHDHVN